MSEEAADAALDAAAGARVTVIVGQSDTGKTTLVARLAGALCVDGAVAVVDADLGQSEIGPPTTVGLGRVTAPVPRLGAADFVAARFVGATTPARCSRELAAAAALLVERARAAGATHIVVDTCGLVAGGFGVAVKRVLIDAMGPDLVLVLERGDECAALAHVLAERRPVVRLGAAPAVAKRNADQRRRWRAEAFARHLAGARELVLDPSRVTVHVGCGRRPGDDPRGAVVGLDDAADQFLGLGVVRNLDARAQCYTIATPVAAVRIGVATIGEAQVEVGLTG